MWVAGREGISIGGCKMGIVRVFTETARVAAPGLSYIVCVVCRDARHGSGARVGRGVNILMGSCGCWAMLIKLSIIVV